MRKGIGVGYVGVKTIHKLTLLFSYFGGSSTFLASGSLIIFVKVAVASLAISPMVMVPMSKPVLEVVGVEDIL